MSDIMENDESPLDECIACGAMGEWWIGWIEHPVAGEIRAFKCGMCGEEWVE